MAIYRFWGLWCFCGTVSRDFGVPVCVDNVYTDAWPIFRLIAQILCISNFFSGMRVLFFF
eukprot:TRINITY_DN17425_c0_g1_i1.p1 TRINITY_DN17425_c0_g1~~TRINITY_DN17425_c0_g1_i1.p1  ORF type:complete len:60 (-),score=5.56 TRINITY_DN17425_c0_g1_i1:415-594(-)